MKKDFSEYKGQDGYLYFYAVWCDVCRITQRIVEMLSQVEDVYWCDVDSFVKESMDYGVQSVPTLIKIKGGNIEDVWIGTRISEEELGLRRK